MNTSQEKQAGIIGLDTSHSVAFTRLLNAADKPNDLHGCRVVAAYPYGSREIESSASRIPGYTDEIQAYGVAIVDSIEALLAEVDVVFLETNDGRLHFEQLLPVLKEGKPTFIDKPLAHSLSDVVSIYRAAAHYQVPIFSSSSLRYMKPAQAIRHGEIGPVLGAETYSPAILEPSHTDLFWYGIHGVETLYTVLGTGCRSVQRIFTEDTDLTIGIWNDNRIGTYRGIRSGKSDYGGIAFGEKDIQPLGPYEGYDSLLKEIVQFFISGTAPVSKEETLEIYAFMEAADESKRQNGAPVDLRAILQKAQQKAGTAPQTFL